MIRRTRGVCLISGGTLYERIDDTLGGVIDREQAKALGAFRGGRVTLLGLRQTLSEGDQLFACRCWTGRASLLLVRGFAISTGARP